MEEDGVTRGIEEALKKIVNTTEQNWNIRKELKKTIYETVNTVRNIFVTLKVQLQVGKCEKGRLERELEDTKTKLDERMKFSNNAVTERRPEASNDRRWERPNTIDRQVLPPHKLSPKLYSDVVEV